MLEDSGTFSLKFGGIGFLNYNSQCSQINNEKMQDKHIFTSAHTQISFFFFFNDILLRDLPQDVFSLKKRDKNNNNTKKKGKQVIGF